MDDFAAVRGERAGERRRMHDGRAYLREPPVPEMFEFAPEMQVIGKNRAVSPEPAKPDPAVIDERVCVQKMHDVGFRLPDEASDPSHPAEIGKRAEAGNLFVRTRDVPLSVGEREHALIRRGRSEARRICHMMAVRRVVDEKYFHCFTASSIAATKGGATRANEKRRALS